MPKRRNKDKVKQVAKIYVRNGFNMQEALKIVENDDYKGRELVLNNKAYEWRVGKDVVPVIEREIQKFDKSLISPEFVMGKLYDLINDDKVKNADKVACLALCSKIIGLTRDSQINTIQVLGTDKLKGIIAQQRSDIAVSSNNDNILPNTSEAHTQVIDDKGVAT
jgi:hypothetical protein